MYRCTLCVRARALHRVTLTETVQLSPSKIGHCYTTRASDEDVDCTLYVLVSGLQVLSISFPWQLEDLGYS